MLNVALLSHTVDLSGAERMLLNLAQLLKRGNKVDPILLLPGREGDLIQAARDRNLRYESIIPAPWYHYYQSTDADYWRQVQAASASIKMALINYACDAILINTLTSSGGMLAAVELDLPIVLWAHGIIESMLLPDRNSRWALANDLSLLETASKVVVNSQWTRKYFQKVLPFSSKLELIYNWTEVPPENEIPAKTLDEPTFVCLNAFEKNKGHEVLIKAARILKLHGINFKIQLYGTGPELNSYKRFVQNEKLQEYIKFHPRTMMPNRAIDKASCLVTPSYVESFSMVTIEAMARKTPVIATASGGPQEVIVDGINGLLVPPGDEIALADAMERLINNPDLAQKMTGAAYQDVLTRFSPQPAREKFEECLEQTVSSFEGYNKPSSAIYTLMKAFQPDEVEHNLSARGYSVGAAGTWRRIGFAPAFNDKCQMPPFSRIDAVRIGKRLAYRGIVPRRNGWSGLGIVVGTHLRTGIGVLQLKIFTREGVSIRESQVDLSKARDNEWIDFAFPPILNSSGLEFRILLEWIRSDPSARLSIYQTRLVPNKVYKGFLYGLSLMGFPLSNHFLYYRTWHS